VVLGLVGCIALAGAVLVESLVNGAAVIGPASPSAP
jgi:hypothetical protein